ncbi:Centrosomal protein poc5 [Nowakowskiella sp. JEL0078]|nr:Centrosomal protein poc5 [Nowakowskiella sp. JEL0078]
MKSTTEKIIAKKTKNSSKLIPSKFSEVRNEIKSSNSQFYSENDVFAEKFQRSVEKWTELMQRAVVADFIDSKAQIKKAYESEMQEKTSEMSTMMTELTCSLKEANQNLDRESTNAKKARRLAYAALEWWLLQKNHIVLRKYFSQWRSRITDILRFQITKKIAQAYLRRTVLKRVIDAWKTIARVSWRKLTERRIKIEAEYAMELLSKEYERRMKELENRLAESNQKLTVALQERTQQHEQLRRAVLRGVSALNMEAMVAMNDQILSAQEFDSNRCIDYKKTDETPKNKKVEKLIVNRYVDHKKKEEYQKDRKVENLISKDPNRNSEVSDNGPELRSRNTAFATRHFPSKDVKFS